MTLFKKTLIVLGSAWFLQACSGDGSSAPTPPPATTDPGISIAGQVTVSADFDTLQAALEAAGLEATLADPTASFTVFAPTDAAFAALAGWCS